LRTEIKRAFSIKRCAISFERVDRGAISYECANRGAISYERVDRGAISHECAKGGAISYESVDRGAISYERGSPVSICTLHLKKYNTAK
jgi:hypothetical protein